MILSNSEPEEQILLPIIQQLFLYNKSKSLLNDDEGEDQPLFISESKTKESSSFILNS